MGTFNFISNLLFINHPTNKRNIIWASAAHKTTVSLVTQYEVWAQLFRRSTYDLILSEFNSVSILTTRFLITVLANFISASRGTKLRDSSAWMLPLSSRPSLFEFQQQFLCRHLLYMLFLYIVTWIPTAKQRLGKHASTIERLFSMISAPRPLLCNG
jgi:hypothetical protein